jgi:hypothetical protein
MIVGMGRRRSAQRPERSVAVYCGAVDRIEGCDPDVRRLTRRAASQQRRLRLRVDQRTWEIYLALEELLNARHACVVDRLVRLMLQCPVGRDRQSSKPRS